MSASAVKGILWAAVAIAFVMVAAAVAPPYNRSESLGLFYAACALLVITILWYRRVIAEAEARDQERLAQEFVTLKQSINLMDEPVSVKASTGVFVVGLSACLFAFYGVQAFADPTMSSIAMFALIALMTGVLALMFVPRIGKPALTIRPDGLAMPLYGFIRWNEIESIGLAEYSYRGVRTHSLDLYVPQLRDREGRLHPLLRIPLALLSRRSPNFIVVHLAFPSLPATLVHALCYDLWKERTGKTSSWNSRDSGQEIEAMQRELRRFPPRSPAATRRLLGNYVNAYERDMSTKLAIAAVVLAALLVGALVLFGE